MGRDKVLFFSPIIALNEWIDFRQQNVDNQKQSTRLRTKTSADTIFLPKEFFSFVGILIKWNVSRHTPLTPTSIWIHCDAISCSTRTTVTQQRRLLEMLTRFPTSFRNIELMNKEKRFHFRRRASSPCRSLMLLRFNKFLSLNFLHKLTGWHQRHSSEPNNDVIDCRIFVECVLLRIYFHKWYRKLPRGISYIIRNCFLMLKLRHQSNWPVSQFPAGHAKQ